MAGHSPWGDVEAFPVVPCPRCGVVAMPPPGEVFGSGLSKMTRQGGSDRVVVCSQCEQREVFVAAAGHRLVPPEEWPLTLDAVLDEDRIATG